MKNNKYILTVLAILTIVSIVGTSIVGIAQEKGKYGGIPASVDNPPIGTTIDKNLSEYYNRTVATGEGNAYWFIGGWGWFNQTEMMNLPSASLMYDISPYDCSAEGHCGTGGSTVFVPVSIIVIIGFVVFVVFVTYRHK